MARPWLRRLLFVLLGVFVLGVVGLLAPLIREAKRGNHVVDRAAELLLVVHQVFETVEGVTHALLDVVPPKIQYDFCTVGNRFAGDLFAHHEPHGLTKGRLTRIRQILVAMVLTVLLERGVQIVANPLHEVGADTREARFLYAVEDVLRDSRPGPVTPVESFVVISNRQRKLIGRSTQSRQTLFVHTGLR